MSANEIKTYTALLSMGNGTAEQISKESDVSYSKIYEVFSSILYAPLESFIKYSKYSLANPARPA